MIMLHSIDHGLRTRGETDTLHYVGQWRDALFSLFCGAGGCLRELEADMYVLVLSVKGAWMNGSGDATQAQ